MKRVVHVAAPQHDAPTDHRVAALGSANNGIDNKAPMIAEGEEFVRSTTISCEEERLRRRQRRKRAVLAATYAETELIGKSAVTQRIQLQGLFALASLREDNICTRSGPLNSFPSDNDHAANFNKGGCGVSLFSSRSSMTCEDPA